MSTVTAPEVYRRRNRLPVITVLLLLLIGTAVVWFTVMEPEPAVARGCNAPTAYTPSAETSASGTATATATTQAGTTTAAEPTSTSATTSTTITTLGTLVEHATLVSTRPANPATIDLTVYNAGPKAGVARAVTDAWRTAGFDSIGAARNDPLYPNFDLRCYGEIRYGAAGLNAARTLLIVAPCAQLVMDGRIDDSVDFAIGAAFQLEPVADPVITQLAAIRDAAAAPAVIEGQTAAPKAPAPIPPLPSAVCPG